MFHQKRETGGAFDGKGKGVFAVRMPATIVRPHIHCDKKRKTFPAGEHHSIGGNSCEGTSQRQSFLFNPRGRKRDRFYLTTGRKATEDRPKKEGMSTARERAPFILRRRISRDGQQHRWRKRLIFGTLLLKMGGNPARRRRKKFLSKIYWGVWGVSLK